MGTATGTGVTPDGEVRQLRERIAQLESERETDAGRRRSRTVSCWPLFKRRRTGSPQSLPASASKSGLPTFTSASRS